MNTQVQRNTHNGREGVGGATRHLSPSYENLTIRTNRKRHDYMNACKLRIDYSININSNNP